MNDERSFERTARAWLELGANQAPDRAVQAVLLAIETTPQERDLRIPWRFRTMNTPLRVGMAAVIGLLLLGAGIYFFGGSGPGIIGQPAATSPAGTGSPSTATATPSADTSVVPAPSQVAADPYRHPLPSQSLDGEAVRYQLDRVLPGRRTMTITLPAGWRYEDRMAGTYFSRLPGPDRPDDRIEWLHLGVPSSINPDPCGIDGPAVWAPAGASIAAISNALTHLKGFTSSPITDSTVGGHAVKTFTITPASDACRADTIYGIWNAGSAVQGMAERISVIDLDGEPLLVQARVNGAEHAARHRRRHRFDHLRPIRSPGAYRPNSGGAYHGAANGRLGHGAVPLRGPDGHPYRRGSLDVRHLPRIEPFRPGWRQ